AHLLPQTRHLRLHGLHLVDQVYLVLGVRAVAAHRAGRLRVDVPAAHAAVPFDSFAPSLASTAELMASACSPLSPSNASASTSLSTGSKSAVSPARSAL